MRFFALFVSLFLFFAPDADARSAKARAAFVKAHSCPATGKTKGACKGWQVDHIKPLKCGGADAPSNMQWLTTTAHKAKNQARSGNVQKTTQPAQIKIAIVVLFC